MNNIMFDLCHFSGCLLFVSFVILPQIVDVPEDILKVKSEIDVEFFGEEQTWGRNDAQVSCHYFL